MYRLSVASAIGVVLLLAGTALPASADSPPPAGVSKCDPVLNTCTVEVEKPPVSQGTGARRSGGHKNGGRGEVGARTPMLSDLCVTKLMSPQPPTSDPAWAGRTTGAIYIKRCLLAKTGQPITQELWLAATPAAATVTPAQLAQRALAQLRIPKPAVNRSPGEDNSDAGVPYTWVNLWTWYWTSPASWHVLSKTASLGAEYATVTVTPQALVLAPGGESASVTCAGPGRPWTTADGDAAPSAGGCGYRYPHVSNGMTSTLSIRWSVTWTGSGGTGGRLPDITTRTTSPRFKVEQIQVVNR